MPDLRLVYDFGNRFPRIGIIIFPLLFILIGLVIFYYHKKFVKKNNNSNFGINKRTFGIVFGILFASFATLFSAFTITSNLNEYYRTKEVYDTKNYKVVEGIVKDFHPMSEGGHDSERFTVNGVPFSYSDYDLTDYGYNNSASKGGAIADDIYVRIGYFDNGNRNVILKLETLLK